MAQQPSRAPNPNPSPPSPTAAAAAAARPPENFFCMMVSISLAFLTYNSISAICRSIHDPWNVAFVSACYIDVLSAVTVAGGFYVLFLYKEAPEKEEEAAGKKSSDACEKC